MVTDAPPSVSGSGNVAAVAVFNARFRPNMVAMEPMPSGTLETIGAALTTPAPVKAGALVDANTTPVTTPAGELRLVNISDTGPACSGVHTPVEVPPPT